MINRTGFNIIINIITRCLTAIICQQNRSKHFQSMPIQSILKTSSNFINTSLTVGADGDGIEVPCRNSGSTRNIHGSHLTIKTLFKTTTACYQSRLTKLQQMINCWSWVIAKALEFQEILIRLNLFFFPRNKHHVEYMIYYIYQQYDKPLLALDFTH